MNPLMELAQSTTRIFDMFRPSVLTSMFRSSAEIFRSVTEGVQLVIKSVGSTTEVMRPIVEQARAAEETEKALAALPKRTQRELTTITVRCPRNSLLLRVMRIPDHLPGAAYDTHLVIPKAGVATYRDFPNGRQRPWFLAEHGLPYRLRCRCHREPVTLTPAQLRGESPRPHGIRLLRL